MKAYERTCLAALDAVLQKNTTLYSVGRKKESAACIKKEGSGWTVYDYEDGNRFDISRYDTVVEACHDLMHRAGVDCCIDV